MNPPLVVRRTVRLKPKVEYEFLYAKSKRRITDPEKISYLKKIRVSPTYTKVVLSLNPKSKLQGIGYDGTGQKQYFYSPKTIEMRSKDKYCNLIHLGTHLLKIQRDIDRLLQGKRMTEQVLNALALKVMFVCNFRIGHPKNVKNNQTYGLTTINGQHVTLKKSQAWIKFLGKKKQWNLCLIEDKQILAFLKQLAKNYRQLDKKGQRASTKTLFSWNGYQVTPKSLNNFLAAYHPEITSKTWRTWYANIEFIRRISTIQVPETKTNRKKASNLVIKSIAEDLHHTPAISKRNYLMGELVKMYVEEPEKWEKIGTKQRTRKKQADRFFLLFLKKHC